MTHKMITTQYWMDLASCLFTVFCCSRVNGWMDMAKDRSLLPAGALGGGDYSSHPNDNRGFTWRGNAALIAQDDALRAAVL